MGKKYVEIDGDKLRSSILDNGMSMYRASSEIGMGEGYLSRCCARGKIGADEIKLLEEVGIINNASDFGCIPNKKTKFRFSKENKNPIACKIISVINEKYGGICKFEEETGFLSSVLSRYLTGQCELKKMNIVALKYYTGIEEIPSKLDYIEVAPKGENPDSQGKGIKKIQSSTEWIFNSCEKINSNLDRFRKEFSTSNEDILNEIKALKAEVEDLKAIIQINYKPQAIITAIDNNPPKYVCTYILEDEELDKLFKKYLDMRKSLHAVVNDRQIEIALGTIDKKNTREQKIEALKFAIDNKRTRII